MNYLILLAVLILATAGLAFWGGWLWHAALVKRREFAAQLDTYQRAAPRHARTAPRIDVGQAGRSATASGFPGSGRGAAVRLGSPAVSRPPDPPRRVATTAADIPPVVSPQPGTRVPLRPQPPRTSGAGTVTMPRIPIRAAVQTVLDSMAMDELAWRREYLQQCETDRKALLP